MLHQGFERFWGVTVLFVVPLSKLKIGEQSSAWKGFTVKIHLTQVWGEFQE